MESMEALENRCRDLEQKLDDSRHLLDTLIHNVPDIIYMLDTDGNIVFISDNIRQYGYTPGQLAGRPILDLIHPKDHEKARFRVNERRTGDRKTTAIELQMLTGGKDAVPFEINSREIDDTKDVMVTAEGYYANPHEASRQFRGTVGIARDISAFIAPRETYDCLSDKLGRWAHYLPICSYCKRLRDKNGEWHVIEEFFEKDLGIKLTHTICNECSTNIYPELHDT